jgi:DNA polymerase/3'-5' exonuclease PolX
LPGLGAKKIRMLGEQLKITSLAMLKEACEAWTRPASFKGFGEQSERKISRESRSVRPARDGSSARRSDPSRRSSSLAARARSVKQAEVGGSCAGGPRR